MPASGSGERRVISSSQTFAVKFILPFAVVGMIGVLFLLSAKLAGSTAYWLPWTVFAAVLIYNAYWSVKLKRVAVDGERIYISDYSREVELPLSAIIDVRENRWLKLHPVTIELDRETPWGEIIKFMPKIRFFVPGWFSHPIVAELREMGACARAGRRAVLGIDRLGATTGSV